MSHFVKLTALLVFFLALGTFAFAQSTPAPQPANSELAAPNAAEASHAAPESTEGKKTEAPEAEKDEEAQFKQSNSVKWLGKRFGLDPEQAYWASVIVNFLIIAGLIVFALKSNLPGLFRERTVAIQKGMEDARRASAESTARLTDIQARLARLDTEIAQMRSKSEQDSAAEDERLRAATEEDKRKIIQNAEQEIAAASNVARRELKQFAAELAIALAEKRITVSEAADKTLVRDFSAHLADGNAASKGGR